MEIYKRVKLIEQHFQVLSSRFWDISLGSWIAFLIVFVLVFGALIWLRRMLSKGVGRIAIKTSMELEGLLEELVLKTNIFFLLILALWMASPTLFLRPSHQADIDLILEIGFIVQAGLWGNRLIRGLMAGIIAAHKEEEDAGLATASGALAFVLRFTLWSLVILLVLDNLDIKVTSLITGLGIGGVAVALATQNILGDLFASLSILFDRPFAVGHFIVIDNLAGTVEHVGIKSTRIRSISGEEVVVSNGDLLKSRIHNYKRFYERRVVFSVGVTYDTPYEKLAAIPGFIRRIVENSKNARFDRAHFNNYGQSSLNFEIVYYVTDPDYTIYMDIQQEINLAIFKRFAQEKIDFAFPTQTIYINNSSLKPAPPS